MVIQVDSGDGAATDSPGRSTRSPGRARQVLIGTVHSFDAARGWGEVVDSSGRIWPFHCTGIADGTREVQPGAPVAFCAVAGHLGRTEAGCLTKLAR